MDFQDFFAANHIWIWHNNLPVKTARAKQRRIKHIRTVGCRDQDHPFIRLKTIHFNKHLIQGLFAFVIAAAKTSTTMPSNRVNFVNEDDTWRIFLALFKHIADTAGTNTNKHFNEIRP